MTKTFKRVPEMWRLCAHYRGQITSASVLARAVFAVWRIKTGLIRLSHLSMELRPAPINYGHTFSTREWRT